jgi:hypothetical protein
MKAKEEMRKDWIKTGCKLLLSKHWNLMKKILRLPSGKLNEIVAVLL